MTLVAIDSAGDALGVVGLCDVDDEVSDAERAGRTPWILGMVVAKDACMRGRTSPPSRATGGCRKPRAPSDLGRHRRGSGRVLQVLRMGAG